MSVSIFDENTPQDGLEFRPYNETPEKAVVLLSASLSGAMDTKDIDQYRQGIEITSETHRFKGVGAKIWSGNIKGYTQIRTLGQALSFTEYKNEKKFNDLLVKFNPVSYIELGENYPYPLIFNEGPQQNKETSVQPFTIPFRNGKDSNELEIEPARSARGSVEDGNQSLLRLNGKTNKIEQIIDTRNMNKVSPFLDEGEDHIGESLDGSIRVDGYLNSDDFSIRPFNEVQFSEFINLKYPTNLDEQENEFAVVILKNEKYKTDGDTLRGSMTNKSATAGYDSGNEAGTDSIAFNGWRR